VRRHCQHGRCSGRRCRSGPTEIANKQRHIRPIDDPIAIQIARCRGNALGRAELRLEKSQVDQIDAVIGVEVAG
jgi:hypothetical protein